MPNYTKVNWVKGENQSYWSSGMRNNKNENIVASGTPMLIDVSAFDPKKKYRFTLRVNQNKKTEKAPDYNLSIDEVSEDEKNPESKAAQGDVANDPAF